MPKNHTDLHMHSCFSDDGQYTPTELVDMAEKAGLDTIAITDHNSVRGIREGLQAADSKNIHFIPGIEIDCTFQDVNLHVLGYDIDYTSPDFQKIERNVITQCRSASSYMLEATEKLGFHLTKEEMDSRSTNGIYTGELFAEILLSKPEYLKHPLLLPYRAGGVRSDNPYVNFYWDYYAQGKPCYVEIKYPSLEETVSTIHGNGGYAVLAHPGVNLKGKEALLGPILACKLNGIEVNSSYHTKAEVCYYAEKAAAHALIMTSGSDFHGKTKPSISMGTFFKPETSL